jgi:hypothetical protein
VSGHVTSEGELNGKATMGPYYLIGSGRLASNSGSGTELSPNFGDGKDQAAAI